MVITKHVDFLENINHSTKFKMSALSTKSSMSTMSPIFPKRLRWLQMYDLFLVEKGRLIEYSFPNVISYRLNEHIFCWETVNLIIEHYNPT